MKRDKIIYWITTGLLSLSSVSAGVSYLTLRKAAEAFQHFGFPDFFRVELGLAKILAAFVLVLPIISLKIKEWAYVGLFIVFVSAAVAHLSVDGFSTILQPLFALCLLIVSFFFFNRIHSGIVMPDHL